MSTQAARCANCGTALLGPWCHVCGQARRHAHRSTRQFVAEVLGEVFDSDSRVWRTLRRLVRDPGELTRAYLAGKRAPQVPPLRLYLASIVLLFAATSIVGQIRPGHELIKMNANIDRPDQFPITESTGWPAADAWLSARVMAARSHQDAFKQTMDNLAEKLPLILLPFAALILWCLYAFERRFMLYDHVIFALHSMTLVALAFLVMLPLELPLGDAAQLLLLALPIGLYRHLRGVYGGSVAGTLARMAVLGAASSVAAIAAVMALTLVAFELLPSG